MSSDDEITTNKAGQLTTRRSTQRSTQRSHPSTPERETRPAIQMMKFQPESQSQDRTSGAHLGITIRWGVRAGARRHTPATPVDLVRSW
jgi:hypothetical protein